MRGAWVLLVGLTLSTMGCDLVGLGGPELVVSVHVYGTGSDGDGFKLNVNGKQQDLPVGGEVRLPAGSSETGFITLGGVARQCREPSKPQLVDAKNGDELLTFEVECFGELAVADIGGTVGQLWLVTATGEWRDLYASMQPRRMARWVWSHDGRRLAVTFRAEQAYDLLVLDVPSWTWRPVQGGLSSSHAPSWSSDGSRLLFERPTSDGSEVAVWNAASGETDSWLDLPGRQASPQWSPDGSKVAFINVPPGGVTTVWVVDAGSRKPIWMAGEQSDWAAWSFDGRYLSFQSRASGDRETWVLDTESSDPPRALLGHPDPHGPAWSPTRPELALVATRDGRQEVRVTSMETMEDRIVRSSSLLEIQSPSWAADGDGLLFVGTRGGWYDWRIFAVRRDGTDLREAIDVSSADPPFWAVAARPR